MKRLIAIAMPFFFLATSCVQVVDEDVKPGGQSEVEEAYLFLFETQGGTRSYTVEADGVWSIEGTNGWSEVTPSSGFGSATVTITVDPYETYNGMRSNSLYLNREGSETLVPINLIQTGDPVARIEVTPIGDNDEIKYVDGQFFFGSFEGTIELEVKSNTTWDFSGMNEWCDVYPSSGAGNRIVTLTINNNESAASRATTLKVSARDVTIPVTITQQGELAEE